MYSYQQPQNFGEWAKRIFLSKTVLSRLILINTAVYLLFHFLALLLYLGKGSGVDAYESVVRVFALPSSLSKLGTHPWTLLTYMFVHENFFHILTNLVLLFFGGMVFQEYLSQRKLLLTYLIGGLAGGLSFVLAFNIFPAFHNSLETSTALGSSAAVLAVFIAIATYVPDYSVSLVLVGRVKLKYIALVFLFIDLASIPSSGNAGGHIAHLGGALWGFLYALALRRNNNFLSFFEELRFTGWGRKSRTQRFDTSRPASGRPLNDDDYNLRRAATQEEIDRILDKISRSGYASLSKEEKELLFKTSSKK